MKNRDRSSGLPEPPGPSPSGAIFRSPWRSDPFDRDEAMRRLVARVHEVAAMTATCGRRDRDNLFTDTAPLRDLARDLDRRERAGVADPDGLEARFIAFAQEKHLKRMRKGAGAEYGPGVLRADVHGAALSLVESFVSFAAEADANLAASLQTELLDVVDRYDALKLASGRLDFVDLLLRARDLVVGHETVRSDLQRRFARIFVDEFQDTDPIQIEMLMLLASDDPAVADWREVRPTPGKLFIVGDPKQSIYRFRRADVAAYWEVRAQLVARGAEAVELGRSFRSRPALQRFVNAAFAPIMTGDAERCSLATSRSSRFATSTPINRPSSRCRYRRPTACATSVCCRSRRPSRMPSPRSCSGCCRAAGRWATTGGRSRPRMSPCSSDDSRAGAPM